MTGSVGDTRGSEADGTTEAKRVSPRVAEARARAEQRVQRQRATLRPFGSAVGVAVVIASLAGHPAPGVHGKSLGVTVALVVFLATLAAAIREPLVKLSYRVQAALIVTMGAAGMALVALQPRNPTSLAGGAAVWFAVARFPLLLGAAIAGGMTVGLGAATALADRSAAAVLATILLYALLALIAHFLKRSRDSQNRTERLLAELEDAREEQTRAAAVAERSRIAGELHDVLAHSLSGAAIQLQGARKLAEREPIGPEMSRALDRATDLVKEGLAEARQAVGALRGDELPSLAQLQALIDGFSEDMHLDVRLRIDGGPRSLPAETSLTLYRAAQEALTNVARYAPRARAEVILRYEAAQTRLTIENRLPEPARAPAGDGLTRVGGGRGLTSMRERVARAGGQMRAGPTDNGWRVELEVPA